MVNAKFPQRDRRCESVQTRTGRRPDSGLHQAKIYGQKIEHGFREFSTN
jgi:hypothetical protein